MTATALTYQSRRLTRLNTDWHRPALVVFLVIVLGHWAEHLVQAVQIWVLGWPVPESRGVLGLWFPWLVSSEALHYGYALVMLVGLIVLRDGFGGRARMWWNVALAIQIWHHAEHLLLLVQAQTDLHLLGRPQPTSVLQLLFPRVELHLAYNALVFVPMMIACAIYWPRRPAQAVGRSSKTHGDAVGA